MAAKRTRKLLVWALCLHTSLAFSQTTFQKTFGGLGNESATWVTEAANGFLISGHVTSPSGNQDALLIRFNNSGNSVWQQRFGGGQADAFNCVIGTADGGFLAVGETKSFGAGNGDMFIVKVDAAGVVAWSKTSGEAALNEVAKSVTLISGGGFLVSGVCTNPLTQATKSVMMRLDQNGTTVWSRSYATANSNQFFSNYVEGNVAYASGGANNEAFFARIDLANGNLLTSKAYAGSGAEGLFCQQPTQDGQLILADHTWSAETGTDVELWAQKVNRTTGQVLWSKVYFRAYDNIRGRIEKTNDNTFLMVPYDHGNTTQAEAMLAKIDANGNLLWSYSYGGSASDRLFKAMQMADGGYLAVGDTRSNSANGNSDILLVKTDGNGKIQGSCAKNAGIQSADFMANTLNMVPAETTWVQANTQNAMPLSLNLGGLAFTPNAFPSIQKNIPLCAGKPYLLHGQSYFAPKMLTDTVKTPSGCDTILHYNLTLSPFILSNQVIGLCSGETFNFHGVHHLAPAILKDTIPSTTNACDTIITYVLKSKMQPMANTTINFCEGEAVMIGGELYTESDTVQVYVPDFTEGCDTVLTYTLVQHLQPKQAITLSFCTGESVFIDGTAYSHSTTVQTTIPASTGCDTLLTYTLIERPLPTRAMTIQFCTGETVVVGGVSYDYSTVLQHTAPSTNGGCDTLVTYTLVQTPQPTRNEIVYMCVGESVVIGGQTYDQPTTVLANLPAANGGCDTVVTYTVVVQPQPIRNETYAICPGGSVHIAGQEYSQPGTYSLTLPSHSGGCDTAATFVVELQAQITRSETRGFCPGETVQIGGQNFSQPGMVTLTLQGNAGACDTIVTYTLQHLTPSPSNIALQCPTDIRMMDGNSPMQVTYPEPIAASDCICPGLELTRTGGPASGSLFPIGATQVCYTVKDHCGQEKSCCFSVNVLEEQSCDTQIAGCVTYELIGITADRSNNKTYRIRVTNNCSNKLVYTAIQIPDGITTLAPYNNSNFVSAYNRQYLVRSPNQSPMYSIRFKSTTDSISNGESDIFEYTLPAQSADMRFINISSRLATVPGYFEAHLNSFNCTVGVTPENKDSKSRGEEAQPQQNSVLLFPNPTSGLLYADLSDWNGQKVQVQVNNAQGQVVETLKLVADEDLLRIDMPQGATSGIYFLEVAGENGQKETMRFMLKR